MAQQTQGEGSQYRSDAESVYKNLPVEDDKQQKKPKKKRHWLRWLVVVVILLALVRGGCSLLGGGGNSSADKDLVWPTSGLATMLPTPDSTRGEVTSNRSDYFRAEAYGLDEAGYHTYVQACKDAGFTVDAKESDSSYRAYDDEGYRLELNYWDFDDPELDISLKTPVPNDPITWPATGLAASIPAPASLTGEITSDSSTSFGATITNTTTDDYSSYVAACMDAGFTVDYSRGDESFHGSNGGGVQVYVNYVGFNTMTISASQDTSTASADDTNTEASDAEQEGASASTNESQDTTGAQVETASDDASATDGSQVTPSFKEAMDSYEAFFDQYVEFMQKYEDEGHPASMLADYSRMMEQYADYMQKMDAIDESTLSTADDAYYIAVTARINQKLLTVSSS